MLVMLGYSDLNMVIMLIAIAAVLMTFEIFTPSFGLLTLCAVVTAAGAAFFAFRYATWAGWIVVACVIGFVPLYFFVLVRVLPKTPFGKKLLLQRGKLPPGEGAPLKDELAGLVDKQGEAETLLRPVGVIKVDGRRYDARSEQGLIEKGKKVIVVSAGGTDVVVREID